MVVFGVFHASFLHIYPILERSIREASGILFLSIFLYDFNVHHATYLNTIS
jgi:hypothetical protein